jgi:hypothetical protein
MDLQYTIIDAYGSWATEYINRGWNGYLITFMFNPLRGSAQGIARQMEKEVERVYATMVTRVVRKPLSDTYQDSLPRWFVCPDYPVPKYAKQDLATVAINNGRHMHATGLIPPVSRMKEPLNTHFLRNQDLYVRSDCKLMSVSAIPIEDTADYVTGYGMKSLARRRVDFDQILILPRSRSELASRDEDADQ